MTSTTGCWYGHYTEQFCCSYGPPGNPGCWDAYYTFEMCCAHRYNSKSRDTSFGRNPAQQWPPLELSALVDTGGPLSHLAGTGGHTDFGNWHQASTWFPVRLPEGPAHVLELDYYSKGGTCSLELSTKHPNSTEQSPTAKAVEPGSTAAQNLSSLRWILWGSNCRPHLHCPLWVPVALPLFDRTASMSLLLWLSAMDGRPRRTSGFEPAESIFPTMWELWESLAHAFHWGDIHRFVKQWLAPELASVGLNWAQASNLTERTLSLYQHLGNLGPRIALPPHLCLTCCRHGNGRIRVLPVRNPFSRLVSFFRLHWLGSPLITHNRWEDFDVFVRYVSEIFNTTHAYAVLPDVFFYGAPDRKGDLPEFTQHDLLHTRAITEWLQDRMLPEKLDINRFQIIHVDKLSDGLAALSDRLCQTYELCEPLLSIPHVNSFSTPLSSSIWVNCWSNATIVQQVHHRYQHDFEAFGFEMDPLALVP